MLYIFIFFLPMSTQLHILKGTFDILILKTLSWGPAHGYAISRRIRESCDDELKIEEGALYPALRRLQERGWVRSEWRVNETGHDARVYTLTAAGRRALRQEVAEWRRYVAAFARVLDARPRKSLT
jgi:transcriptional regulator